MGSSMLERNNGAWLESHAHEWVEAGLISNGQAAAIEAYEHVRQPLPPQRLPMTAELASYLGSVLAIMGGAVVVGQRWSDLTVFGRLAIAAAVALVGFVSGTWLMRLGEAGTSRLGSYLWTLGTCGVGMAVAVLVDGFDSNPGGWLPLAVGLPVLVIGLSLWRNLERPLQFLTGAAGFGFSLGGIAELTDANVWLAGIVLLAVGLGFAGGAAFHHLEPRLIVLSVGSFSAYIGAFMLGDYNEHLGPATALLVAAAVVAFALHDRLSPLLVLGVIGSLIATQALLATTFTGVVASLIVTLVGLAIVVIAIVRTWRTPGPQSN